MFKKTMEARLADAIKKLGKGKNPLQYVVHDHDGQRMIVFEKKVNWVSFDREGLERFKELLAAPSNNGPAHG